MNTLPDWKTWNFHVLLDRVALLVIQAKRFAACAALALLTTLVVSSTGFSQTNTTGSISGKVDAGSMVTAVSIDTGYTRNITASAKETLI